MVDVFFFFLNVPFPLQLQVRPVDGRDGGEDVGGSLLPRCPGRSQAVAGVTEGLHGGRQPVRAQEPGQAQPRLHPLHRAGGRATDGTADRSGETGRRNAVA